MIIGWSHTRQVYTFEFLSWFVSPPLSLCLHSVVLDFGADGPGSSGEDWIQGGVSSGISSGEGWIQGGVSSTWDQEQWDQMIQNQLEDGRMTF